jgi:type VI secretion system secreted protein VgrG
MNLDISTGITTIVVLAGLAVVISLWTGYRTIRSGQKLPFFRKRREQIARGWRLIFLAFVWAGVAFAINRFAEPVAYTVFPPSPTVTMTGTITLTPTISLTPTITETPTITNTPSVTNTPEMPQEVATLFQSTITPNPDSVISPAVFARALEDGLPVDPSNEFENPIGTLYGSFSYDKMLTGSQWSALWYRGDELLCVETLPWDGGTGGYAYSECTLPADQWQPGEYELRIFVGMQWINSGQFVVIGDAPTPRPTLSPTLTVTLTRTLGPSPTLTPRPPTLTPTRSLTPTRTHTAAPTRTSPPTSTVVPSRTPRITDTRWPSPTPGRVTPTP